MRDFSCTLILITISLILMAFAVGSAGADSTDWTRAATVNQFSDRGGHSSTVFQEKLWVIGGTVSDIWNFPIPGSSTSGESGTRTGILADNKTDIRITKGIWPVSVKEGTETTITITLENRGRNAVHDIEILDDLPPVFSVTGGDAPGSSIQVLEPDENRTIIYRVRAGAPGTFTLNGTKVMYADTDGNYRVLLSNKPTITVLAPLLTQNSTRPIPISPALIILSLGFAFIAVRAARKK